MNTSSWVHLSNQAVAVAGVVYFLALVAHLVQTSSVVGSARRRTTAPVAAESAASVTADAAAGGSGGVALATGGPARVEPDHEHRIALFGRLGFLLTVIAVGVHGVALVSRGLAAGRVPWGNMYEFTLSGSFVVALLYVVLYRRLGLSWMAPFVVGFVVAVLMVATLGLYTDIEPLPESLKSYWLVIHVMSAILATGAFTLGGITSAIYLVKQRRPDSRVLSRVPSLAVLDRTSYRIHAFAFPVWTFAVLITGPIWAHQAWSTYWSWDPKEVWAFITWVVYAAYLHARATAGWKGRNAAILALVGVATLWFNFIGINYFSTSTMHGYANPDSAPVIVQLDR